MKKFYIVLILSLFFSLLLTNLTAATVSTDFKNQQAPSGYIYPQEFDNLVMDLIIPSGIPNGEDKLKAITVQNLGLARDFYDIEKIKLWSDSGPAGFQGMAVDKEIRTFTFDSLSNSWYLNNLNETVPVEGLRIFVSADISKNATAYRTIQMKISLLSDKNSNGVFDLGDLGVFMESKNNGPTDTAIINDYYQEIRSFVIDNLAPKSVITDPKDGATLTAGTSYIIKGVTKDQGGSNPQWVKIGINPSIDSGQVVWYDVAATSSNYLTWEYNWKNITEGTYILKIKSADWIGNVEIPGEGINIKVVATEIPVTPPPKEKPPVVTPPAEKPISEMTIEELKAKIEEIQLKLIELMSQLIQLLQQQIAHLAR